MRHRTATVAAKKPPRVRRERNGINWSEPRGLAVDGFTVAEIVQMALASLIPARCTECGEESRVEPGATGRDCLHCGSVGAVTSPLVKLGIT